MRISTCLRACIALLCALFTAGSAHARVIITADRGGIIDEYVQRYAILKASGELVVIDGRCVSACTLIMSMLPSEQVCITPNAEMWFHSGLALTMPKKGKIVAKFSPEATGQLWLAYPEPVRAMLREHGWAGGPHPSFIEIHSNELQQFYRPCEWADFE